MFISTIFPFWDRDWSLYSLRRSQTKVLNSVVSSSLSSMSSQNFDRVCCDMIQILFKLDGFGRIYEGDCAPQNSCGGHDRFDGNPRSCENQIYCGGRMELSWCSRYSYLYGGTCWIGWSKTGDDKMVVVKSWRRMLKWNHWKERWTGQERKSAGVHARIVERWLNETVFNNSLTVRAVWSCSPFSNTLLHQVSLEKTSRRRCSNGRSLRM